MTFSKNCVIKMSANDNTVGYFVEVIRVSTKFVRQLHQIHTRFSHCRYFEHWLNHDYTLEDRNTNGNDCYIMKYSHHVKHLTNIDVKTISFTPRRHNIQDY